jgi:hypothetical protein
MSGIPAFFKATSIRDFATLKFKMHDYSVYVLKRINYHNLTPQILDILMSCDRPMPAIFADLPEAKFSGYEVGLFLLETPRLAQKTANSATYK